MRAAAAAGCETLPAPPLTIIFPPVDLGVWQRRIPPSTRRLILNSYLRSFPSWLFSLALDADQTGCRLPFSPFLFFPSNGFRCPILFFP